MTCPSTSAPWLLLLTIAAAGCGSSAGSERRESQPSPSVTKTAEQARNEAETPRASVARGSAEPSPTDAAKPSEPPADLELATECMQARDWKAAAERLKDNVEREPSAAAYLARGICRDRMGQDKEALDDFIAAEKLEPARAALHVARAAFFQRREQPEPGMAEAEKALELEPDKSEAQLLLALLRLQQEIQAALAAEKTGEILSLLATNISWRVDMPGLPMPSGYEHVQQATAAAETDIQQIIERHPKSAEAHAQLGRIRFDLAVLEGARADWSRFMGHADAAARQDAFERALARARESLDMALQLDPRHASAVAWQAAAQHAGDAMGDAAFIAQVKSALELDPCDPSAIQLLVGSLRMTAICDEPLLANQIQDLVVRVGQPAAEAVARDAMRTLALEGLNQALAEVARNSGLSDKVHDASARYQRFHTARPFYEQLLARLGENGVVPPQLRD